jgi:Ca2+-binding EF-hand superfamily protein
LKAADLDGTGSIDVAEFRGSAMLINSNISDDEIKTTFKFFDRDNCGHLTVDDIIQSVNVITSDHKVKNHAHGKTSLKMQELEEDGIDIDKFIKIIRDYEHQVAEVWEQFQQMRKKSHNA